MERRTTDRLLKNYYNARKNWEGWCFLNNIHLKEDNSFIRKYTDKNELLFHCRYLLLKDLHIELYKIIKNKNSTSRDNIFKLLKQCDNDRAKELLIEINDFQNEFDEITKTRDKFYAHLDENYEEFSGSFEIENYYRTFEYIESAIIILGKEKELKKVLESLPSRNDFKLSINER